jgi:hypothetical protein
MNRQQIAFNNIISNINVMRVCGYENAGTYSAPGIRGFIVASHTACGIQFPTMVICLDSNGNRTRVTGDTMANEMMMGVPVTVGPFTGVTFTPVTTY